jgi:hypothetical protein
MRFYIAGPMTGIPEFNFPLFNQVASFLHSRGHTCFNPAERDTDRHPDIDFSCGNVAEVAAQGFSLDDALADDTHFICKGCDAIYMLPGWEGSNGARAEHTLAFALKRKFFYHGMDVPHAS